MAFGVGIRGAVMGALVGDANGPIDVYVLERERDNPENTLNTTPDNVINTDFTVRR